MKRNYFTDIDCVRESNRIEGISREPTEAEVTEFRRFMGLKKVSVQELVNFVAVYQPDAKLRDKVGMGVMVGNHIPPKGGKHIVTALEEIVSFANTGFGSGHYAYDVHHRYETLHPFMDGNGRSGRMVWYWMMHSAPLGFLHHWYYQSLQYGRK